MTSIYPWQHPAWQQLEHLRERLPHAILFHGPEGIGKATFAQYFAQSLLCEMSLAGQACNQCPSCLWFSQYGHPDYRRIRPEAFEDAQAGSDDASATEGEDAKTTKSTKTPSKEIKIDQIRALSDFMNIATHRQGRRVVLLYPAEALNTAAANALLKTLEEPPPHTLFLLVTHNIDRLLPTILSRCRQFALTLPSEELGLAWLEQQGVRDAQAWLAEQGGAPLAAYACAHSDSRDARDTFLRQLAEPSIEGALRIAEQFQKTPVVQLIGWLQRWLYDLFSVKLSGRIRYYPRYRQEMIELAIKVKTENLLRQVKVMTDRRAIAEHPLSAKLFIEAMLLDYVRLFS